jgi:hypothetical protein
MSIKHSTDISALAKALVAAQAEFSAVPKGSNNPFFKSKYAALPDVVAHAAPVLARHGLAVSQHITATVTDGKASDSLITILLHESGQFIQSTMLLHLPKADPQGQGSAVTYARRYSYMAALGLVADDDDDGNAASRPKVAQSAPKPQAVRDLTTDLREKLTVKYGEPIKGKEAVEKILGKSINKLSELTEAEVAGVLLELG